MSLTFCFAWDREGWLFIRLKKTLALFQGKTQKIEEENTQVCNIHMFSLFIYKFEEECLLFEFDCKKKKMQVRLKKNLIWNCLYIYYEVWLLLIGQLSYQIELQ